MGNSFTLPFKLMSELMVTFLATDFRAEARRIDAIAR